jgi:hypothetical protein
VIAQDAQPVSDVRVKLGEIIVQHDQLFAIALPDDVTVEAPPC